ncbi:thiamine diphosphokinase [Mesobaculum littorinae]|uniref:Thiamine diphosphokinase n=1 Tax=Mesobaculum littorinae TaxID=2486419 RepID=A0A438AJ63_9RHOB|nr:thiamine diphosphokinase [Mesobaculum littorinae]
MTSAPVLSSAAPVTLLGGGAVTATDLALALRIAPQLVAADGGAQAALDCGVCPDAVVGDFDSLGEAARAALPADRLHHVAEQESTDFDKCLHAVEAPLLLALGFTGLRLDHTLAALNALVRHGARRVVMLGSDDICFHARGDERLDLPPGLRLSLFPMAAVTGRSEGLEWPIDGLKLAPDGRVGTSNRVTGRVRLRLSGPGMLVLLPRAALAPVLAGWGFAGPGDVRAG